MAAPLYDLLPPDDDVEGDQVHTWRGGSAAPVEDRFHLARKILAIWNEEDPLARARLLVAFGRFEPVLATPERTERMKDRLDVVARSLGNSERARLRQLLEGIERGGADDDPVWEEHTAELGRLVRQAFGWELASQPETPPEAR